MLPGTILLLALAAQTRPSPPAGRPPASVPAEAASPVAAVAPAPAAAQAPAVAQAPVAAEAASPYLSAGIAAFRHRRFAAARAEFEKAEAADPQSAAAAFYLGYAHYKIGEPSRRMNADKQQARELFAKAFSLDPAFKPTWGR